MVRKLKASQTQELLKLHESGMGYQLIEAETGTGYYSQKSKFLVLNSQMIIDDTPQILNEVKNVFKSGYRTMLFSAPEVELKNIRLVENLSNYRVQSFSASAQTGAIHQQVKNADGVEKFTRLSAFEDDFRIDTVNKRLVTGSFSTTYDDYQYCKNNNINPVERYALPNDEDIKWAFHIRPLKIDTLQRGIVEPANNQSGGGIEVYFEQGTSNNTFLERTAY